MHAFKLPWLSLKKYSFSTTWLKFELSNCIATATATAKSLQSCPTLCDPIDGSPPGSPVSGILQARTLEWVAISFSNAWKWKVKGKSLSCIRLLATPWTAAYESPSFIGFSRQEYWSGLPLLVINSKLVPDLNLAFSLLREQSFLGMLLLIAGCMNFFAFK